MVPRDFHKKTTFVTTGAEATENAVKIARAATGRSTDIAFAGSFYGRTFMGMSLTGKVEPYKVGFGPIMPGVYHTPLPVELHGTTTETSLAARESLFKADVDPSQVAPFIVEPVQGEGGLYEAPAKFLVALREIADKHGTLLNADEVQTGFARTGRIFTMERAGVCADLTTIAKGLGGGFPIAAVTGRASVMDAPNVGGLGGTCAGNPVSIAASNAVLDVIADEQLCAWAEILGARLKQRLHSLSEAVP